MALLDGILDPILGSSNLDKTRDVINQNKKLYGDIDVPTYDQYVANLYNPEAAKMQLTSEDPLTKSMQMSALAKMSGLANTGLSDADQADFNKAIGNANQVAKSQTASILQNAQNRGVGGSGLEFLMREQAGQDAAQRAQDSGLSVAANAAKQRALYNQAFLQGTSNVRDQDYRTNSANTNIVNQFNQANTQARNQAAQQNANTLNNEFMYNQGLKDKTFGNQMTKANAIAGVNNQIGQTYAAEQSANAARNAGALGSAIGLTGGYLASSKKQNNDSDLE